MVVRLVPAINAEQPGVLPRDAQHERFAVGIDAIVVIGDAAGEERRAQIFCQGQSRYPTRQHFDIVNVHLKFYTVRHRNFPDKLGFEGRMCHSARAVPRQAGLAQVRK